MPPGGVPLAREGEAQRRQAHPHRSAVHADQRAGGLACADPRRQRHCVPARAVEDVVDEPAEERNVAAGADRHMQVRQRDIAFLGGLINYVLHSPRWNTDPFFKEYVANYPNAATIINADFKDTEDQDAFFSALFQFTYNTPS